MPSQILINCDSDLATKGSCLYVNIKYGERVERRERGEGGAEIYL